MMGGLGNQLFQIATAYAYAKDNGKFYKLNMITASDNNKAITTKDNREILGELIKGKLVDVVIHTKNNPLKLREATKNDFDMTFQWASDSNIRKYSFQQEAITQEKHYAWYNSKINDPYCLYLLLEKDSEVIGSIRFEINKENEALISYLIDNDYHGHGYGNALLSLSLRILTEKYPTLKQLVGFVIPENINSRKIFERQGYLLDSSDQKKLKYIKQL
jgi:RimJ/RimL family protein N-acetyltransferase